MIVVDDVGVKHEGDNVQTSQEKKNQFKEDKKKSSVFARITKYLSYAIGIIIFVYIFRKLWTKVNFENCAVEMSADKMK